MVARFTSGGKNVGMEMVCDKCLRKKDI